MEIIPAALARCFRRARLAPARPLPDGTPPGFATRVLASLASPEARDWTLWLLPRAVATALAVTVGVMALEQIGQRSFEDDLSAGLIASALEGQP